MWYPNPSSCVWHGPLQRCQISLMAYAFVPSREKTKGGDPAVVEGEAAQTELGSPHHHCSLEPTLFLHLTVSSEEKAGVKNAIPGQPKKHWKNQRRMEALSGGSHTASLQQIKNFEQGPHDGPPRTSARAKAVVGRSGKRLPSVRAIGALQCFPPLRLQTFQILRERVLLDVFLDVPTRQVSFQILFHHEIQGRLETQRKRCCQHLWG